VEWVDCIHVKDCRSGVAQKEGKEKGEKEEGEG
jgi:hypothetical protein